MVQLVALLQAPQDFHTGVGARLLDQHLLEAALQGRILFHRAAVILRGGGTNATQIAPGQSRLEHAAGISSGTLAVHHGVEFIDKQHHTGLGFPHLLQHPPQALLKLAAKFCPCHQSSQIQGHQPQTLEGIGHFAGHHALGQQLGHGRFAHARLADQHRIVLAAAGEHLNQQANLLVTTHHGIELPGPGRGGEIAAIGAQRTLWIGLGFQTERFRLRLAGGRPRRAPGSRWVGRLALR